MSKNSTRIIFTSICNILILLVTPVLSVPSFSSPSDESREQVTLVAILEDQGDPKRWDTLIQPALDKLKTRHPELNIQINYTAYPYDQAKKQMINEISNQTHVDLISLDQIWLGEFAENGMEPNSIRSGWESLLTLLIE